MSLISPITSLFAALVVKLKELRNPKVTLPEGWEQFLGEPELWECTRYGESFGKADEVELTYIQYRLSGKTPEQANLQTLIDWDCLPVW